MAKYNVVSQSAARPVSLVTASARGDSSWDMVSLESSDLDEVSSVDSLLFPLLSSSGNTGGGGRDTRDGKTTPGERTTKTQTNGDPRLSVSSPQSSPQRHAACRKTSSEVIDATSTPLPVGTELPVRSDGLLRPASSHGVIDGAKGSEQGGGLGVQAETHAEDDNSSSTGTALPPPRLVSTNVPTSSKIRNHRTHIELVLQKAPKPMTCTPTAISSPCSSSPTTSLATDSPGSVVSIRSVDMNPRQYPMRLHSRARIAPRAMRAPPASPSINGGGGMGACHDADLHSSDRGRYSPLIGQCHGSLSLSAEASPFNVSDASPLRSLLMDPGMDTVAMPGSVASEVGIRVGACPIHNGEDCCLPVEADDLAPDSSICPTVSLTCPVAGRPLGGIAFECGGSMSGTMTRPSSGCVSVKTAKDSSWTTPITKDGGKNSSSDESMLVAIDSGGGAAVENQGPVAVLTAKGQATSAEAVEHSCSGREEDTPLCGPVGEETGCFAPALLPVHEAPQSRIDRADEANVPHNGEREGEGKRGPVLCTSRTKRKRSSDTPPVPPHRAGRRGTTRTGSASSSSSKDRQGSNSCSDRCNVEEIDSRPKRRSRNSDYARRNDFFGSWPTRKQAASEGTWKV